MDTDGLMSRAVICPHLAWELLEGAQVRGQRLPGAGRARAEAHGWLGERLSECGAQGLFQAEGRRVRRSRGADGRGVRAEAAGADQEGSRVG